MALRVNPQHQLTKARVADGKLALDSDTKQHLFYAQSDGCCHTPNREINIRKIFCILIISLALVGTLAHGKPFRLGPENQTNCSAKPPPRHQQDSCGGSPPITSPCLITSSTPMTSLSWRKTVSVGSELTMPGSASSQYEVSPTISATSTW